MKKIIAEEGFKTPQISGKKPIENIKKEEENKYLIVSLALILIILIIGLFKMKRK